MAGGWLVVSGRLYVQLGVAGGGVTCETLPGVPGPSLGGPRVQPQPPVSVPPVAEQPAASHNIANCVMFCKSEQTVSLTQLRGELCK